MKNTLFLMISTELVWNGLLKALGGLPGLILSVFFDFPNNYFLTVHLGPFFDRLEPLLETGMNFLLLCSV